MKRTAIFVEGHTEAIFVRKLITELAVDKGVTITGEIQFSGIFQQQYRDEIQDCDFEILIANCCGDETVITQLRDRYESLMNAGYSLLVGLRDLYPFKAAELEKMQSRIQTALPRGPVSVHVCIAVAEIEAWFIEEYTHFKRLHASLTKDAILTATNYDIDSRCAESLIHPAEILHEAYKTVGYAWKKRANQVSRTIEVIDYDFMRTDVRKHSTSFAYFMGIMEGALT